MEHLAIEPLGLQANFMRVSNSKGGSQDESIYEGMLWDLMGRFWKEKTSSLDFERRDIFERFKEI